MIRISCIGNLENAFDECKYIFIDLRLAKSGNRKFTDCMLGLFEDKLKNKNIYMNSISIIVKVCSKRNGLEVSAK